MNAPHIQIKNKIKVSSFEDGSVAFITQDPTLLDPAKSLFGREKQEGLAVKVFHYPVYEDFYWGKCFDFIELQNTRSPLEETMKIQNIFAFEGLAPRVYGIFTFNNMLTNTIHYATLTDYVGKAEFQTTEEAHRHNQEVLEVVKHSCYELGIIPPFGDFLSSANAINGKLVDWQGSGFKAEYVNGLKQRYLERTNFGDSKYQTVPELDISEGIRNTAIRYKDLTLADYDFRGKKVIDIGCSGGNFLNYAMSKGAKRAVGVDWERVISGSRELSNYLGNFNIDYFHAHLAEDIPQEVKNLAPFDLIIFTSMTTHVGVPEYLHTLGKQIIVEVNHAPQIEPTLKALEPHWSINYVGQSTDFGDRAIYSCLNKKLR